MTNLVERLLHHNAIPRQLDLQLAVRNKNELLVGEFLEMKTEEPLNLNEALQTASRCRCGSIAAILIRKGANPLSLPNDIRADFVACLEQYSLSSEAGDPALLMNIQRLMTVCEAIVRLRKNSESYLGIRNRVKAEKIETALQTQLERGLDNMDWKPVEDALKYHRIFGFFGFKNTKSMDDFKKVSTPSDSLLR